MIILNKREVTPTQFPDKTTQVWNLSVTQLYPDHVHHEVVWTYDGDHEIFTMMQLVDLLKAETPYRPRVLVVDFLPYARQDKMITNGTTFALRTFASILNTLGFVHIDVLDVHSAQAERSIPNLSNCVGEQRIRVVAEDVHAKTIVYPDRGAFERYHVDYNIFPGYHYVVGTKVRNNLTGAISSYSLNNTQQLEEPLLVVDDICDGGATFAALAREFKRQDRHNFHLYTTHGIYSKGTGLLFGAGYRRIFTYHDEKMKHPRRDI